MHQTLYRKWRPQTFGDVIGQNHITDILKYEVANNKISHAYLFCGSRGTGKTTSAKIFARAVNCISPVDGEPCGECENCKAMLNESATDIVEMDAASNNGVDYIRDIKNTVVYAPAMLKYRVYIIDEVHMLSASAFNALLKTLEEPPERVIFILATTEVNKLPVTVVSRCQRFDFKRITVDNISSRLMHIAENEDITLDEKAARLIAKLARGGMRDAIGMLELCSSDTNNVDVDCVNKATGVCSRESVERVFNALISGNNAAIFDEISDIYASSIDITSFWEELIEYIRDLMVVKTNSKACGYLELTRDEISALQEIAQKVTFDKLCAYSSLLDETLTNLQKGLYDNRILCEMTLIKMASSYFASPYESLSVRISELEKKLSSGFVSTKEPDVNQPPEKDNKNLGPTSAPKEKIEPVAQKEAVLEPLDSWIEVAEKVKEFDTLSGVFLASSKAFLDRANSKLIIHIDTFGADTLDENKEAMEFMLKTASDLYARNQKLTYEIITNIPKDSPEEDLLGF